LKQGNDVVIVGAGPAGAVLAYELARKGISVLLLEKEKLPRYKCCAGGVTTKTAKLVDFDFSEVVEDTVSQIDITLDPGTPYPGQHSEPLMYTVMRDAFDHFLVKQAQQQGATLLDGQRVTRVQMRGDWVEVSTTENTFRSRLVAGADGAYSVVARELGMARSTDCYMGVESETLVAEEDLTTWRSRARMELGYISGGYGWVFPKRHHLSVGAGCITSRAGRLKASHSAFLASLGAGSHNALRYSSHLIPTCTKGRLVLQDKALLLGDAAGLADPLTGEGIHNAILSAQLAAPVIEDLLAHEKTGLEPYQQIIEEKIISELKIARVLSKLFIRFPHLAFAMLNRSEGVWRAGCGLMLGQVTYADIRQGAGGFRGILDRLLKSTK
jgi:geranylgeranyl reductase family protein